MEGLFRTTPHTFGDMTDEEREPLKDFIREIVEVGFKSGLLFNGLTVYPSKKTVTGPQDCIDSGWYVSDSSTPIKGDAEYAGRSTLDHCRGSKRASRLTR